MKSASTRYSYAPSAGRRCRRVLGGKEGNKMYKESIFSLQGLDKALRSLSTSTDVDVIFSSTLYRVEGRNGFHGTLAVEELKGGEIPSLHAMVIRNYRWALLLTDSEVGPEWAVITPPPWWGERVVKLIPTTLPMFIQNRFWDKGRLVPESKVIITRKRVVVTFPDGGEYELTPIGGPDE